MNRQVLAQNLSLVTAKLINEGIETFIGNLHHGDMKKKYLLSNENRVASVSCKVVTKYGRGGSGRAISTVPKSRGESRLVSPTF